jgi:hypothetical protein
MYSQREKEYEIVDVLPSKGRLLARRSETLRRAQGFHFLHVTPSRDIMATIFHEYIHYICFTSGIFPKRYQYPIEEGIIYTEQILMGNGIEDEVTFKNKAYDVFILSKWSIDYNKYSKYPNEYGKLDENQRAEVDEYIKEKNLSPEKTDIYYPYHPSNHAKDELNAHNKTLEASSLDLFTISQKKISFYDEELQRYQKMYDDCIDIEKKYNYSPEGYKNK